MRKIEPFLEVWRRDDDENGGFLKETRWVCKRDEQTRQWTVKVSEGKTVLKAQNMQFSRLKWVVNKSPDQVAKNPWDKIWKIYLSIFRDWKVHLRGSCEGSRKTFWVHLVIGASTREQVAKLSHEKQTTFQKQLKH